MKCTEWSLTMWGLRGLPVHWHHVIKLTSRNIGTAIHIRWKSKMYGAAINSVTDKVCLTFIFRITISFIYSARFISCTEMFISNSWMITAINFRVKTKWSWTIVQSTSKTKLTLIMSITISFIFRTCVTITESNLSIAYSGTVN